MASIIACRKRKRTHGLEAWITQKIISVCTMVANANYIISSFLTFIL